MRQARAGQTFPLSEQGPWKRYSLPKSIVIYGAADVSGGWVCYHLMER